MLFRMTIRQSSKEAKETLFANVRLNDLSQHKRKVVYGSNKLSNSNADLLSSSSERLLEKGTAENFVYHEETMEIDVAPSIDLLVSTQLQP
ncbi:hypothetical protein DICVIV_13642 [Dictyocaulus viviparus]|uniref:Uncharacterized protein n=1 Tax=Dictyocaulus viviparus TaxID=29172 RepID=A0A0D8X789_DICVI|nr:hypothetical protein DICVIV_13642 [Dictyocaulus viviparus]